ncbi:hypothetical protein ACFW04_006140 [Cataglyphis niger]
MVTLVQQQQQTSDDNHQYQNKEQDRANGAVVSVESHRVDKFRGEVSGSAKETAVVVPGNGSVGDSSTQCSDVDDDDEEEETEVEHGWITNLPVSSTIIEQHQAITTTNGDVVLPNADPSNFGDVCVKNSTNVHLGNKTFYKGPVTIKQFVYTNPAAIQEASKFEVSVSDANVSNLSTNKDDGVADKPIFLQNTQLNKGIITSSVRFVQRNEWGAQPPSEPLEKLKLPVPYVIISHTVTDFCDTQSQCTFHVRFAQTFHIESRKWSDIAYNFLVGGDGLAYIGRNWDYVGAHSFGFNKKSIGISFIGTFNTVKPPKIQLHAAQKIIEIGVKIGKIASDYKLLGHRQVSKTLSPGDALFSEIQTWPHWSPEP